MFGILSFHQLKATGELFIDPARYVSQPFRSEATSIPEASIHGHGILILKVLNNHVEQSFPPQAMLFEKPLCAVANEAFSARSFEKRFYF
jgi:hypothetical protein